MVTVIRFIRYTLLVLILLVGGCIHYLWTDYQRTSPCFATGEAMGLTRIQEHAQAGSNYPARCGGFYHGHYRSYRAW